MLRKQIAENFSEAMRTENSAPSATDHQVFLFVQEKLKEYVTDSDTIPRAALFFAAIDAALIYSYRLEKGCFKNNILNAVSWLQRYIVTNNIKFGDTTTLTELAFYYRDRSRWFRDNEISGFDFGDFVNNEARFFEESLAKSRSRTIIQFYFNILLQGLKNGLGRNVFKRYMINLRDEAQQPDKSDDHVTFVNELIDLYNTAEQRYKEKYRPMTSHQIQPAEKNGAPKQLQSTLPGKKQQ